MGSIQFLRQQYRAQLPRQFLPDNTESDGRNFNDKLNDGIFKCDTWATPLYCLHTNVTHGPLPYTVYTQT